MSKVLVVEISGKRPGTSAQRPTEIFKIGYDHLIISNNSDGYETEWPIVMVPEDYAAWYKANVKTSENAWYAPMNRSYAIKYAREHGYDYLVQLDDNIIYLELAYVSDGKDGYCSMIFPTSLLLSNSMCSPPFSRMEINAVELYVHITTILKFLQHKIELLFHLSIELIFNL